MKMKAASWSDLWTSSTFYVFAVLYGQILSLFLPFFTTKIFAIYMILITIYGIWIRKIRYRLTAIASVLLGIYFILRYVFDLREVISYVYASAIVIIFAALYIENTETNFSINSKKINQYIFLYLLLNVSLYIWGFSGCFQNTGSELRFRGALPHSNMLGAVIFSLFLLIFWDRKRLAWCNKLGLTLIVFLSRSRTYILFIMVIWLIQICSVTCRRVEFRTKLLAGIAFLTLFGRSMFQIMVTHFSFMSRFRTNRLGGNGRQYLQASYLNTILKGSVIEKVSGIKMAKSYLAGITVSFSHSFTENSVAGIFLLFGVAGFLLLLIIFSKYIRNCKSVQGWLFILLNLLSLLTQDTLLSIQTGIMTFMSLAVAISYDDKTVFRLKNVRR